MAGDDGIAMSIERLRLSADQVYVSGGGAIRDKDLFAVQTSDPLEVTVTWEQLDRGFPA
ncbi:hypothetical protein ACFWF7_41190 [Nocardia sp. NPDC060256]|uniref:hypothetical protein n=1 Tax=unclassified Nocardia TaxID=2637762 RepID=UPI00365B6DA1